MMRQYELVERVQAYNPDTDEALLNRAIALADGISSTMHDGILDEGLGTLNSRGELIARCEECCNRGRKRAACAVGVARVDAGRREPQRRAVALDE